MGRVPQIGGSGLSNNVELTGPLPPALFATRPGKLQFLRTFSIYNTEVYGPIPTTIGNFPNLTSVILYNNRLTGKVPTTLGNCSQLQYLMLENNRLEGEFAVDTSNMSQLQTLSLANNSFTGDVSTFFSRLPKSGNLSLLDISRNVFSGELPSTSYLSPFSRLKVLMVGHNQLEGPIPWWLWSLPKLQVMDISNNHIHGTMPEDFSSLRGYMDTDGSADSLLGGTELTDTTLYNQNLVLTIQNNDIEYSSILSILTSIDLSSNELTGQIATNLNQLLMLQYLNLSRNFFRGEIPHTIGLIPLQQLDLSNNELVGGIPEELASQSKLSSLELANNNLAGPIPSGQQISSFRVGSFIPGNDRLCGPPLPVARSCPASEAWEPWLSAYFKPAGFVLGVVAGFVAAAGTFLCWGPAQRLIHTNKSRIHSEVVGLWRPPMYPKL